MHKNIYIDVVETISSEKLWFDYKKYFWEGAVPTIQRMKYEEFVTALEYLLDCLDHSVLERVELNDFFWFTEDEEWKEIIGRKLWED